MKLKGVLKHTHSKQSIFFSRKSIQQVEILYTQYISLVISSSKHCFANWYNGVRIYHPVTVQYEF